MMFLHCPPWRKPRPASPSDVARSYQASDIEAQRHQTQEPVHESEHPPSPHSKYHPGSISRIIRRRFSQSKSLSAHHEPSKFMFPFPRKSSRSASKPANELAVLGAYGSSLMSESRYDSDAQFISTPRRDIIDSPAHRARRRMELSDLIERSQEQRESERWAIGQGDDIPEPPESVYGMRFIQTPPSTIGSHRGPYPKVHHAVSFEGDQEHTVNSARSLPDLNLASQRGNGSSPAINYIPGSNDQKRSTDSQSMDMSSHKHGVASSNPLSNQPPDLVVAKRRQRTDLGVFFMDGQPVHLEDMGISHRLASQSTSSVPVSCNPSISELIHSNRYGVFMNASQENMPIAQRSTTSINSGHHPQAAIYHHHAGSSYYSHHPSSPSANESPHSHSIALDTEKQAGMVHDSRYNVATEEINLQHDSARASPAIGSKFHEHCDNEVPTNSREHVESKDARGAEAPRKVSVGWMSGGRRVGYGYSPVPDDEAAPYQQHGHGHPHPQQLPDQKAEAVMSDANLPGGHTRQNHVQRTDLVNAAAPTTPEWQSTSVNHHANNSEADPASLPREIPNQTSPEYTEPSYLRAILAGRYSREQDCELVVIEKRSTRSLHAAETPPMTQSEHCHVPQSSNYTSQQSDTALHRCVRLSQSLNSNPQNSKKKGKRGRRPGIVDSPRQEKGQHAPTSEHNAVDIDPDYLGIEHDLNAEDVARLLRPSNNRGANWVRRLSTRQETSPDLYQDFGSGSLERANSTKSIGTNAEELASMYQECLEMPGSFEGSRWASRTSRLLWDLVTTDDR